MQESAKSRFKIGSLWTFQQDRATTHKANVTQNWCRDNLPKFWPKELWLPCSHNLNPTNFSVWFILETKACSKVHCTVNDLKLSLEQAQQEIQQEQLCTSVEDVQGRLKVVSASKKEHFEWNFAFFMYVYLCIHA